MVRIVVIDTGYDIEHNQLKLCNKGIDLTHTSMMDTVGHGNNIAHIIANALINDNYCILPIKVFDGEETSPLSVILSALTIAYRFKPDIINMSYGGFGFNTMEWLYIEALLDNNVKIVAAAGNDNVDLDKDCNYYPACYDNRIITVGNLKDSKTITKSSNYGNYVKKWNIGYKIYAGGIVLTGTSQAAAIETGKQVKEMLK
jgi:subtilisin family serine protease